MKITNVIAKRYKKMKKSDMAHAEGHEIIIVRIETDSDYLGVSFIGTPIFQHGEVGDVLVKIITRNLKNIILGENPLHTEYLWNKMYDAPWRVGMRGFILDCIAAIDFALWDIKAKVAKTPISNLFGGKKESILTYANLGQQLSPEETARKAEEYVNKGHKAIKVRAGLSAVSLKEATKRIAAVREAVGLDVKLLVDIGASWDVSTAIDMLKKWQRYNIYWLEEPVVPEDVDGYKLVRSHAGDTFIAGGEQNAKFNDFKLLIEKNAIDIAQPNASCTGGITSWLKIYNYLTSQGIPISPWNLQQIHVPLALGLPNVKWIEYFTPDRETFQNTLLQGPIFKELKQDDGIHLVGSDSLGLGLELNEGFAERHEVED